MKRSFIVFLYAIAFGLLTFGSLHAVEPSDPNARRTPIVTVYEKTHQAVVNISGQRVVTTSTWPGFDLPNSFDFWGPRYQRRVEVLGSGFVIHQNGYVVTNAHVVEGTDNIQAIFNDGQEYPARILNIDQNKDLAILVIDANQPLQALTLGRSDDLMIGETVIAIGNPYGYANTLTQGVISALSRNIQVSDNFWLRDLIQTDAPINPGNSGGPLLNINGDLIGINTAIKADAQNIGFAIPVDALVNNISHMLMPEQLRRVRLGLTIGRKRSIAPYTGLLVDTVAKSSPADDQGMQAGDVILRLDGTPLTSMIDFYVKIIDKAVGEPLSLEYVRPKESPMRIHTARLTLAPRPIPDGGALAQTFFQMTVSELTDAMAQRFNFESAYPVLIVTAVTPGGMADQINLKPGDLILSVNRTTVRNMREFSLEMENVHEGDMVEFEIMRIDIGIFGQVQHRYSATLKAQPTQKGVVF